MHQFMRITRERKLRDYSFPVEFSFLTTYDSFRQSQYVHLSFSRWFRGFSRLVTKKGRKKGRKEGKLLVRTGAKWISRRARRSRNDRDAISADEVGQTFPVCSAKGPAEKQGADRSF